jgi:hypothetical protein
MKESIPAKVYYFMAPRIFEQTSKVTKKLTLRMQVVLQKMA